MTNTEQFAARLESIYGGDYEENSRKFFKLNMDLRGNLAADEAGPQRYEHNLDLETISYTQELADRRRKEHLYPEEIQQDIINERKSLLKRLILPVGIYLILALAFAFFGGSDAGHRWLAVGVGTVIFGAFVAGAVAWWWKRFKEYINDDVLYKLPDTDFVSESEQDQYRTARREEDRELIERLQSMQQAASAVKSDLTQSTSLYELSKNEMGAVLALQSARDNEEDEVYFAKELPQKATLVDAEHYRHLREENPDVSSRVHLDLMQMEIMIKTVTDCMTKH